MTYKYHRSVPAAAGTLLAFAVAVVVIPILGCANHVEADKFAAATNDEYTEQLTNAIVGSPSGVVTIGADGGVIGSSGGTGGGVPEGGGGGGGSSGGGLTDGGVNPDGGDGGLSAFGFWHFDDCSPTSPFLLDSSGEGANAQHALGGACVPGISNLGVDIRSAKDVIQVADEPQFTVGSRVAVAAWVHPNTVSGHQPIVIKRLNDKTSFSLGIHNGNIEMSVVLTTGTTVISRAPIAAGTWTHVAGMYDGTFVFLFINGQQFGQVFAAGTLRDVIAPLRFGATTGTQFLDGIIDEVFVTTDAISKDTLTALSCISRPSTLAVTPPVGGPVTFDTTVHYDIAVRDNDVGFCAPKEYATFLSSFDPTINAIIEQPNVVANVEPGSTVTFGADVSANEQATLGVHSISFLTQSFNLTSFSNFEALPGQLVLDLVAPSGCFVFQSEELMITDPSVVDDPVRTAGTSNPSGSLDAGVPSPPPPPPSGDAGAPEGGVAPGDGGAADGGGSSEAGVWSFGYLMRQMAPTPDQAPAMTLQLLQHWLSDQNINGFVVAARPAMQQQVIDIWPKTASGDLDLDQAPLTLQAIVNRVDVRNLAAGSAGEGRFVFGVNGPINFQQFTVIVEYSLPASTQDDVLAWANRWHALSSHPFPSPEYNQALEDITRRFTDRGAAPGGVNGSALAELRTNEIALSFQWELRGFVLSPATGFFDETTVKETPDLGFNGTPTLADFVNQNAPAIKAVVPGANGGTVPAQFEGQNFLAGSVFNNLVEWDAPGIADPDARFHQSLNTCNGCHGPETNTTFLMITPRFAPGGRAFLSPFLTGTSVQDPFSGQTRQLNDLARRQADLTSLVCGTDAGAATAP
jgi:hypothetical protein